MKNYTLSELSKMRLPLTSVFGLFLFLISVGCASPDIALIDVKSGKCAYPEHANQRQFVCLVNRESSQFTTMREDKSELRLQTFNSRCERVLDKRIPHFPSNGQCYAFSKDGKKVVYFNEKSSGLHLRNIASGQDELIKQVTASSSDEIPFVAWSSNSKIVAVLRMDEKVGRRSSLVVSIDIISGQKKDLYRPTDPSSFDYSLSPNGQCLAFADGTEEGGSVIQLLDLDRGSVRAKLGGRGSSVSCPSWHPSGDQLCYVDGRDLKIWKMSNGATRVIHSIANDKIFYRVLFGDAFIACVIGDDSSVRESLLILDPVNGRELRKVKQVLNGNLFFLSGDTVLAEVGL